MLHGLALWSVHPEMPVGEVARRLEATLRPAQAPAATPPRAEPQAPPHPDKPAPHREIATTREPAPAVRQEPVPRPSASNSTVETPVRSPAEAPAAPPAPAAQPAVGDTPRAAPPVADSAGMDGMRQYRISLATQAKRFKLYPARAMEAGMAGTAEVRVTIGPTGFPLEVQLAKSSGHELLDRTALDMIRKAAPRTTIPEALRGRTFTVGLPVVFDLADQ